MGIKVFGKCDACGVDGLTVCCSSLFGATTYSYCQECFALKKEPYNAIVYYISAAGRWPDDINEVYQKEVRRQLALHNKSEEVFRADVDRVILDEQNFFATFDGRFRC